MAWADKVCSWFAYTHTLDIGKTSLRSQQNTRCHPQTQDTQERRFICPSSHRNWYNAGKNPALGPQVSQAINRTVKNFSESNSCRRWGGGCVWVLQLGTDCDRSAKFAAPDLVPRLQSGQDWYCCGLGSPRLWGVVLKVEEQADCCEQMNS